MSSSLAVLSETFRQEATELLAELAHVLEAQSSGQRDDAALTTARRVAHNLKGAALVVGARPIAEKCHFLEDELEAATKTETTIDQSRVEEWLLIVTDLEKAVEDFRIEEQGPTGSESTPLAEAPDESNVPEATTRVEIRRLDEAMGTLREIVQSQVRLTEQNRVLRSICEDLSRSGMTGETTTALLRQLANNLQQNQQQIQEFGYHADTLSAAMNKLRMTPLAAMEPLLQRTVRETLRDVDRLAHLEVQVGEVEVDIRLYELLKDPLLHILRNAIAHGIEPEAQRQAHGKPCAGRIRIDAQAEGAFVRLQVSDDGRGIDPQRVVDQAVERGWVTAAAATQMADADRRALIFLPGLSTAEVVTTIAGRGIGMHAVQRNIEELGGSVAISAKPALGGTTFEIYIPATVLSVSGVLVQAHGVTYALALNDVTQVASVAVDALERSEGYPVFMDATRRPVRVQSLDSLLGGPTAPWPAKVHLVVVRRMGQELALIVDRVLGEQEFVTRALPWNLEGTTGINGTLILADGTVALFLDTTAIFAAARQLVTGVQTPGASPPAVPRILVVDDSLSVRTLQTQTLTSAGYEVISFADGRQAWDALQRESFDLVVSDVQMPLMDGFELTSQIRHSGTLRSLPVILVTSKAAPADIARGAEVGADEYVVKGQFDQDKLLRAVRRLIN